MPTPSTLTWDLDVPRRASVGDLGGGAKVQAAGTKAPDPVRHLTANDVNQWAKQLAALNSTTAVAKVSVRFWAGAPFVYKVAAPGTGIDAGDSTVTDNGAGDTSITWPANTFPPVPAVEY